MHEEVFCALEQGATLLTASRRLTRVFTQSFHSYQRQQGRSMWTRPDILPLDAFVDRLWREWLWKSANENDPALLDPLQEQIVWEQVIRESAGDSLLEIPETARQAIEAWQLIQAYRLPMDGRFQAADDWAAFAAWLRAFQNRCESNHWIERARLMDWVGARIRDGEIPRPSILYLAGFDELTPQEASFLETLGAGIEMTKPSFVPTVERVRLRDSSDELRQAARWARRLLEQEPGTRIGIIVPDLNRRRPRVERIFREILDPAGILDDRERAFHVSLGPALSEYPLVRTALLMLEFALGPLPLPRAGLLLRSPFAGGAEIERSKRALLDARLRRHGAWEVAPRNLREEAESCPLFQRLLARFEKEAGKLAPEQRPSEWSRDVPKLLDALGWPGDRALSSREFQVMEAWRGLLSSFASLDVAMLRMSFDEAVARLRRIADATVFQVENEGAPVQIMGVLEAAGVHFDHLWIVGLHDESLPAPANPHPFIPISMQREHKLPHSSAERELEFATKLVERLLASAPDVVLSYPEMDGDRALSPSPLVAGDWRPGARNLVLGPGGWAEVMRNDVWFDEFVDEAAPGVAGEKAKGGASLFKDMAACPFRAFAKHRLGARPLEEATLGLSYKDRGSGVHKALELIWSELGSHARLMESDEAQLADVVRRNVEVAIAHLPDGIGRKLERRRLQKLLVAWLEIEKQREPFVVLEPEEERVVSIGGLQVKTRADRVDEVAGGRDVILDYKTGDVKSKGWDTSRPDEPQLPLYCATSERPIAGAAFALIRIGELAFRGLTADGVSLPGMKKMFIEQPVAFDEQVTDWRRVLERLAQDFRGGHAEVDPKHGACEYCGLWALCRIREHANDRG